MPIPSKSSLTTRCPPEKGKWVHVFTTGSRKKHKRILISPYSTRCFESLLSHLTDKLNPTFGAVRNIYTVEGKPVTDLDSLQNEKTYVVSGVQKYRPAPPPPVNDGSRRSAVGQGLTSSRKAPDGGDVGSPSESKTLRRLSKASFDSAQQVKLQQILKHSNQRHIMN